MTTRVIYRNKVGHDQPSKHQSSVLLPTFLWKFVLSLILYQELTIETCYPQTCPNNPGITRFSFFHEESIQELRCFSVLKNKDDCALSIQNKDTLFRLTKFLKSDVFNLKFNLIRDYSSTFEETWKKSTPIISREKGLTNKKFNEQIRKLLLTSRRCNNKHLKEWRLKLKDENIKFLVPWTAQIIMGGSIAGVNSDKKKLWRTDGRGKCLQIPGQAKMTTSACEQLTTQSMVHGAGAAVLLKTRTKPLQYFRDTSARVQNVRFHLVSCKFTGNKF